MAKAAPGLQRLLLNPLDEGGVLSTAQWKMKQTSAVPYAGLEPKAGSVALKFQGTAQSASAKGDFTIHHAVPGEASHLGAWFHIAPDSNVASLGFQITDAEGEVHFNLVPADWSGWKWIEQDLTGAGYKPAYKQPEKNGKVDLPLKGVNVAWFTKTAGPTFLGVDALAAVTQLKEAASPYSLQPVSPASGDPGKPFLGQLLVHNYTDKPLELEVGYSLQGNPLLFDRPLPDPVLGSNFAEGKPSWVELDGQRINDSSLTDGATDAGYSSDYAKGKFTEGFQFVDLGEARRIIALHYLAGDANWAFKLDVASSPDGKTYQPVAGLQGVDMHKKWGLQKVPVNEPFSARFLRLRYHNNGEKKDVVRAPLELYLFDGIEDEKITLPTTGDLIEEKRLKITVGPRDFSLVPVTLGKSLSSGSYLFGMESRVAGDHRLSVSNYFVNPVGTVEPRPEGRFGMNVSTPSHIPRLHQLGISWVRFENLKWNFFNPAPDDFRFDGSVAPWNVPFDAYMRQYREAGFSILPFVMQTPKWATSAGPEITKNRTSYPPIDYNDYGKAVFELVARYGATRVPTDQLKAADPKSGLNLINTYELWNEPNLNAPSWGPWVSTVEKYFDLFRIGAESVKRADPTALVSNAGWAGFAFDYVDKMRTYTYPDGKTPLDFTDVFNMHVYTGKQEPETAITDPNANRDGAKPDDGDTYENRLMALADWRDDLKPGMPIWMTEVGYDVGGPIGRSERLQAAKLPRCMMIALANGVEKIFVYREVGSIPAQHAGAGVMREDGSVRPSFFTLATLVRQLDGVTDARTLRLPMANPKVWAYAWNRRGEKVFTTWTYEGTERLGVDLGRCTVTDAFGGVSEMHVGKDFEVGIFPVYITRVANTAALSALEAQAAQREAQRKAERARAVAAKAYLFDFGTDAHIGTRTLGKPRWFTSVVAEKQPDETSPHGFLETGIGRNIDRAWIKSPLDRDGIQFMKASTFRISAAPGTYELSIKGDNFSKDPHAVVTGAAGGEIKLPLPAEKKDTVPVTATVTVVAGQPLEVKFPSHGCLLWMTLIQTDAKK